MLISINLSDICPLSFATFESHRQQQEQKRLPLIVAIFRNIIYHAPQLQNLVMGDKASHYVSLSLTPEQNMGIFKLIERKWQKVAVTACYESDEFKRTEAQYKLYNTFSIPWCEVFRTNFPRLSLSKSLISAFAVNHQKWLPILEKLSDTMVDFRTISDTLRGHLAHFLPALEAEKLCLTLIKRDSRNEQAIVFLASLYLYGSSHVEKQFEKATLYIQHALFTFPPNQQIKVLTQDLLASWPEKYKRKREESEEPIPKKIKYSLFPEPEELFQPFETS